MNIGLVGKMEQRKNSLVLLNELNKVFSVKMRIPMEDQNDIDSKFANGT